MLNRDLLDDASSALANQNLVEDAWYLDGVIAAFCDGEMAPDLKSDPNYGEHYRDGFNEEPREAADQVLLIAAPLTGVNLEIVAALAAGLVKTARRAEGKDTVVFQWHDYETVSNGYANSRHVVVTRSIADPTQWLAGDGQWYSGREDAKRATEAEYRRERREAGAR